MIQGELGSSICFALGKALGSPWFAVMVEDLFFCAGRGGRVPASEHIKSVIHTQIPFGTRYNVMLPDCTI